MVELSLGKQVGVIPTLVKMVVLTFSGGIHGGEDHGGDSFSFCLFDKLNVEATCRDVLGTE